MTHQEWREFVKGEFLEIKDELKAIRAHREEFVRFKARVLVYMGIAATLGSGAIGGLFFMLRSKIGG